MLSGRLNESGETADTGAKEMRVSTLLERKRVDVERRDRVLFENHPQNHWIRKDYR